jgi:predicted MPP superfamily phosphohydrolase
MSGLSWVLAAFGALVVAGLAYGWFEAGWLRAEVLDVPIGELPAGLEGLRIAHLSDFHLGMIGRGQAATERAVAWVAARKPDLVCITGDLVSHPRGKKRLRELVAGLSRPYVVLGNHDVAITRDPFSRAAELDDLRDAVLLRDDAVDVDLRGARIRIVGVDPLQYEAKTADPARHADPAASFNLLLCHFPRLARRLPEGSFGLILSGHHHAGQIVVPYPGGRVPLSHPRTRELAGMFETPAGPMHVSAGLGTSLVPFRFFARPEVNELVLRRAE